MNFNGDPEYRVLDPTCGTRMFIVAVLNRCKYFYRKNVGKLEIEEFTNRVFENIVGFDLNPLSVLAARTNYLISMIEFLDTSKKIEIPVYLFDSLLGDFKSLGQKLDNKFDFVVGNPPWIRWGLLPNEYRDSTKVSLGKNRLFSLKGFEARWGGGEKDIFALFVYFCTDKYLKTMEFWIRYYTDNFSIQRCGRRLQKFQNR